jgi:hypothetical protein|tara:strand:+ start:2113 stop:2289 length:177 start_codon:yes stop_codon:yes gene_type:complete
MKYSKYYQYNDPQIDREVAENIPVEEADERRGEYEDTFIPKWKQDEQYALEDYLADLE